LVLTANSAWNPALPCVPPTLGASPPSPVQRIQLGQPDWQPASAAGHLSPLTQDALGEAMPAGQHSMSALPCLPVAPPSSAVAQVMLGAVESTRGCTPCALPHALLQLEGNQYTGGLPDEWAASNVSIWRQRAVRWPIGRSAGLGQASIAAGLTLRLQSRHGPRPSPSAALLMPTFWLTDCHHTLSGVSPMFGILCCSWRVWGCVLTACQAPPSPPPGRAQARWAR
jgi:hypothetical protein